MSGYESVFLCAVTRAVEGGERVYGLAELSNGDAGFGSGASGEARPFTSARKKRLRQQPRALAALFVGDNGLKSTTDSPLRGNTEPASVLIKQLL